MAFENLNSLETLSIQNNKLTRIPEEIMEPIMDTLRVVDITDNPLICSCELMWFPNLLQDLKNRDDEMTQKKRPVCTMINEHREYFVQNMPIERMNCIGKNMGRSASNNANSFLLNHHSFIQLSSLSLSLKQYHIMITASISFTSIIQVIF